MLEIVRGKVTFRQVTFKKTKTKEPWKLSKSKSRPHLNIFCLIFKILFLLLTHCYCQSILTYTTHFIDVSIRCIFSFLNESSESWKEPDWLKKTNRTVIKKTSKTYPDQEIRKLTENCSCCASGQQFRFDEMQGSFTWQQHSLNWTRTIWNRNDAISLKSILFVNKNYEKLFWTTTIVPTVKNTQPPSSKAICLLRYFFKNNFHSGVAKIQVR